MAEKNTTGSEAVNPAIRSLTPKDWPVVERLFGSNGACGGCWCMSWRVPRGGKLWDESKGDPNKRAFKNLLTKGKVFGALAFADDEPIGWCCVGPRGDFPRLERVKALATSWERDTWSVTCFYIKSKWRRKGVATALLAEATKVARKHGAKELEAYPVKPYTNHVPGAFAWTGVPVLFEKHRFVDVTPPGNSRPIYRKALRAVRSAK